MKRVQIMLILLTFISITSLSAQGFLHASGKKIVDGKGDEILLRGMGLGGWLVPEGYMLQTASFANSPTEIRNKISSLIGEPNTDQFYKLYRQNYVRKKDIDKLAEWGFNSIRLPMHYNLFTPKGQVGVYLQEGFQIVDSLLNWCKANKLYLILDLHAAPGGQNDGNISDYVKGEPSLWESELNKVQTVDLWRKLAERYSNEEWIGGYDLLNETNWSLPGNAALRDLSIRITNAIREVDKNHIVFIEGNSYANDFNGLTPAWDNNMVYSFHKYWNQNSYSAISNFINMRESQNVPLWLGESGENSNVWFTECVKLMEDNNIGWCWWPHKKIGSIAGPLSAIKNSDYDQLLKYWKGEVSQPSVQFAVNALTAQAMNLDIDKCIFRPDVIDALFRQVKVNENKAFKPNIIPGTIYAVDYDLGRHLFAYKDSYFQRSDYNSSSDYNSGWEYRNDGVDIERCSDILSNGYNVGWITTGETLVYTVNVIQDGNYRVDISVASNQSGGKLVLDLDNNYSSEEINITSTGGYQSWMTISTKSFPLSKGEHKLTVKIFNGGFNLNYLEFVQTSTGVKETDPDIPGSYSLSQNYPNPFNPETVINYQLPNGGHVSLKIYDLLGREVSTLVNEYKQAGIYNSTFNALHSSLTSGIYFYKLVVGEFVKVHKMILMK